MLFDVNSGGMTVDQVDVDTLSNVIINDSVFCALYQNEEFRIKFAKRILYIGKEIFSKEKCELFLRQYVECLRDPIAESNLRYYNTDKMDEFDINVENTKAFFEGRYNTIWNSLVKNMGEAWLEQNGIQK